MMIKHFARAVGKFDRHRSKMIQLFFFIYYGSFFIIVLGEDDALMYKIGGVKVK